MGCAAGVSIKDERGVEVRAFHTLQTTVQKPGAYDSDGAQHISQSELSFGGRSKCQRVVRITSDEGAELASTIMEQSRDRSSNGGVSGSSCRFRNTFAQPFGVPESTRQLAVGRLRVLTGVPVTPRSP